MVPEFRERNLVIATMHGKDRVMRSLLEQTLGVRVHVTTKLNTDLLGTFSGEVARIGTPEEVARRKCEWAMEETGFDLAVASEGSFGPHPYLFGVPVNEELVYFFDRALDIHCIGKSISPETNFLHAEITNTDALLDFAKAVHFPTHAIILKNDLYKPTTIQKGIQDYHYLMDAFNQMKDRYGRVYAETDMRAMFNPSRMNVIEKATEAMLNVLLNRCPSCHAVHFKLTDLERGLPCSQCASPTQSILAHHYACKVCGFKERKLFPKNREVEDPMYCDHCNP
ncbi:MAG: hypothetical protein KF725_07035 [Cyclobacteriaceae bacterium]|nr:hypothetical protein [Cyclobacteriaceae bacterium]UYN88321.1 MAG: hypothetical protein KIT51_08775 [Cyclobacteriaceae bacterium]